MKTIRNCGFVHIYWKNPWRETSFYIEESVSMAVVVIEIKDWIYFVDYLDQSDNKLRRLHPSIHL